MLTAPPLAVRQAITVKDNIKTCTTDYVALLHRLRIFKILGSKAIMVALPESEYRLY